MGWIDATRLLALGKEMANNDYGQYLINLAKNGI